MKNRLRSKVWWPGIDAEAERFVRSCDSCQKVDKNITVEKCSRRAMTDGSWQDLALDFKSLTDGKQLVVPVDYYSRYVEVKVLTNITTETMIVFLLEVFGCHGIPLSLTTDNGPQLVSKDFTDFLDSLGVSHYTSVPYWAQANGLVERQNRAL